jgi:hypothetical protein
LAECEEELEVGRSETGAEFIKKMKIEINFKIPPAHLHGYHIFRSTQELEQV